MAGFFCSLLNEYILMYEFSKNDPAKLESIRCKHFNNRMVIGIQILIVSSNVHVNSFFESLILAQDERWRRALSMQVERRLCLALR